MYFRYYRNLLYEGRDVKLDTRLGLMIPADGFPASSLLKLVCMYDSSIYSCFVTHTPQSHLIKTSTYARLRQKL